MRRIDPVGLRDIHQMFSGNVSYWTLKEYRQDGRMPDPAGYVNEAHKAGRVPVWDRKDIEAWGVARGWKVVTNV